MVRKFHLTLMLALLASQAVFVNFANAASGGDYGALDSDYYNSDDEVADAINANLQTAGGDDEYKKSDDEDEDGGLDNDDETLTLKSGGQQPKSFDISMKAAELSKFVTTIIDGDTDATSIEISKVPAETLAHVIDYLKHHKGTEPNPLPCPVRSIHMQQIVDDKWDATWIDAFDKKTIFEII
eukprot:496282_1